MRTSRETCRDRWEGRALRRPALFSFALAVALWSYPPQCGSDCADVSVLALETSTGVIVIMTERPQAFGAVRPEMPKLRSPDGRIHACTVPQGDGRVTVKCFLTPGGR